MLQHFQILQTILQNKIFIAISGCHGKTTTTAIIGEIFVDAIICGGIIKRFDSNVKIGNSNIFVIEADESDDTFNKIPKDLAVVTNIKSDHLDFHKTEDNIHKKFAQFITKSDSIAPYDSSSHMQTKKNLIFYEKMTNYQCAGWQAKFQYKINNAVQDFKLNLPGIYNVKNAMAAIACANYYNVSIDIIKKSLVNFSGVKRRLSLIGQFLDNKIIDNYSHHPDKIIATLKMLSDITKNVIAIIQPHRSTRIKDFFYLYIQSLTYAKHVILLDVFSAGENNNGFDSAKIYCVAIKRGINNVMLCNDNCALNSKIIEIK